MSRTFFRRELETVATYWRISRTDGLTFGFTSHNQDLEFDGVRHRAAPGMIPSAIRRTANLELESAEVQGALTHDAITAADLSTGRYDGSEVEIGIVDWESLDRTSLYHGEIGMVSTEATSFEAELRSAKGDLERDTVPRTSPTCRAQFCGPGCNMSSHRFTHEGVLTRVDASSGRLFFEDAPGPEKMLDGHVRWINGAYAGIKMGVLDANEHGLLLDMSLDAEITLGSHAFLREGCDHTLSTCHERFANAVNFQGEPFLPGNDALIRYPTSSS